jgi:2',3'-cyclic-nucleotide 2'-phosphodiesterase / 3'-nucleotidase
MPKTINIVYTSDTHGRVTAYDFLSKSYGPFGISRLSSFLESIDSPCLLLDNGDFMQGSPLLDYTRKNHLPDPVAKTFNALGVQYVNLGNHDFNYGLRKLASFQSAFHGKILCANIHKDGKPAFQTHAIHEIDGIRVAIIGVTTEFTPFWEKPENLDGMRFLDAVETTRKIITEHNLKQTCDLIVVMYHGGFTKSIMTDQDLGTQSIENKGYDLFQIDEIDVLLTGHQHIAQAIERNNRVALQTSHNAKDVGFVQVQFDECRNKLIHASIVPLVSHEPDHRIESLLESEIKQTNNYLSQSIGVTNNDMSIQSPLDCRIRKHPLFQLVNQIQLVYTGSDISLTSLPNETHGFPHDITLNDIAANFPFENDLVVLEVTGAILKDTLEQNAKYFAKTKGVIHVNPAFLYPKVEHYNYDVYDGIDYIIDVSLPIGKRVISIKYQNEEIKPDAVFTLALNSYRAIGSGGFDGFKQAKRISTYPVSYFDLVKTYLEENPILDIKLINNFIVK